LWYVYHWLLSSEIGNLCSCVNHIVLATLFIILLVLEVNK
jgi:hypothetical protein